MRPAGRRRCEGSDGRVRVRTLPAGGQWFPSSAGSRAGNPVRGSGVGREMDWPGISQMFGGEAGCSSVGGGVMYL